MDPFDYSIVREDFSPLRVDYKIFSLLYGHYLLAHIAHQGLITVRVFKCRADLIAPAFRSILDIPTGLQLEWVDAP